MIRLIRAVYQNGQLQLLDPVELSEGQEVELTILSKKEKLHAVLGDLLVEINDTADEAFNEAALLRDIEEGFRGKAPLSQTIIDERNEGP